MKHPKGKTNEEILAEVEKKVVHMISNNTHKVGMRSENPEAFEPRQTCFGRDEGFLPTAPQTADGRQENATS
jgi:hypothetical protein